MLRDSCVAFAILTLGLTFNFLVEYRSVFRPVTIDRFRVHSILNRNVCLLRLFPSITIQTVRALLHPPIEGIVMQTYGSGKFDRLVAFPTIDCLF
jgi:L-asparaginase/Glu-tRNA(Gln) amidotransferase subunit D